jgi:hypothetical protein
MYTCTGMPINSNRSKLTPIQRQNMSTSSMNLKTDPPIATPVVEASGPSIDTAAPAKRLIYRSVYHPPDGTPWWTPYTMSAALE